MLGQAMLQGNMNVPNAPQAAPMGAGNQDQEEIVVDAEQQPIELQRELLLTRLGEPMAQKMINGVLREEPKTYAPGNPQNKGLFGAKGTLRDIIGILGDSLLVGNDVDPVYGPQRKREKMAEAMEIERNTPGAGLRYMERIDPEFARKYVESDRSAAIDREEIGARTAGIERQRQADLRARSARPCTVRGGTGAPPLQCRRRSAD